ncbi:cobalamin biosynthesis protein [Streptomyces sp. JNUCC 64]
MTPPSVPAGVIAGVGASRGVGREEVVALVRGVLAEAGVDPSALTALATVDRRAGEPGITGAAALLGVELRTYSAGELAGVPVPHPSDAVRTAVGTSSVAEAAALYGGGTLLVPKRTSAGTGARPARATCALARHGDRHSPR